MEIYRLESPARQSGMWYNADGEYDPVVQKLSNKVLRELPMEPDERYSRDGKKWFTGVNSYEQLLSWFSERDISELVAMGFKLYKHQALEYRVEETQVIFTKNGVEETEIVEWSASIKDPS